MREVGDFLLCHCPCHFLPIFNASFSPIRVIPSQLEFFRRGKQYNILIFLQCVSNALNMHSVKSQIFLTNRKPRN
jgi:hypothetical protein